MATAHLRHPAVFERLRGLGDSEIIIDPVDLPLVFCLRAGTTPPRLRARRKFGHFHSGAAVIRAPFRVLLHVFAAADDGDAAFFARDLVVEGDMSAVVALRNAIESEELVLSDDLASILGPFAAPARLALGVAGA
ncbi:MAG: SCP2 sterol-binding domain-containing protein, partial [Alphaproteobacteria bacterium]